MHDGLQYRTFFGLQEVGRCLGDSPVSPRKGAPFGRDSLRLCHGGQGSIHSFKP